jgi:hypothetical protein
MATLVVVNPNLAEGEGFEPPKACTLVVFKTTAIDHSAIPPALQSYERRKVTSPCLALWITE